MFKACFDGPTGATRWVSGLSHMDCKMGRGAGKRITNDSDGLGTKGRVTNSENLSEGETRVFSSVVKRGYLEVVATIQTLKVEG